MNSKSLRNPWKKNLCHTGDGFVNISNRQILDMSSFRKNPSSGSGHGVQLILFHRNLPQNHPREAFRSAIKRMDDPVVACRVYRPLVNPCFAMAFRPLKQSFFQSYLNGHPPGGARRHLTGATSPDEGATCLGNVVHLRPLARQLRGPHPVP